MARRYKIVILGDGGVGKTTWIQRLLPGSRERGLNPKYVATLGVDVHILHVETNYGPMVLDLWDTAGQEKFNKLSADYYIRSNGAVIMYDHGSHITYKNVPKWYLEYIKVIEDDYTVIVCNKINIPSTYEHRYNDVINMNAKNDADLIIPLQMLLRKIARHDNLTITSY